MTDSRATLALGTVFVVLGSLFTLSPDLLSHSPVGFERRGAVHHLWHYVVLIGGLAVVIGVAMRDELFEAVGLVGCAAAVALNLVASVTGSDPADVSGIDVALRLIVLVWILLRLTRISRAAR